MNACTNRSLFVHCWHSKWKADRAAVTSLCVSPDAKLLLSAGQIIKMWDLATKEVYRVSVWSNSLINISFTQRSTYSLALTFRVQLNQLPCFLFVLRNSQATPRLWQPCVLPPHVLLTAMASISCLVLHTIDCSASGECWSGDVRGVQAFVHVV